MDDRRPDWAVPAVASPRTGVRDAWNGPIL